MAPAPKRDNSVDFMHHQRRLLRYWRRSVKICGEGFLWRRMLAADQRRSSRVFSTVGGKAMLGESCCGVVLRRAFKRTRVIVGALAGSGGDPC